MSYRTRQDGSISPFAIATRHCGPEYTYYGQKVKKLPENNRFYHRRITHLQPISSSDEDESKRQQRAQFGGNPECRWPHITYCGPRNDIRYAYVWLVVAVFLFWRHAINEGSQFLRRYNDINDTTSRKQGDKNKLWLLLNSSSGSSSGSSSAIRRSPYREQSRASPGFTRSPRYDTIKSAWFESSYSNASWRPDIIGSDLYTKHDT